MITADLLFLTLIVVVVLAVVAVSPALARSYRAWRTYRGQRLITCPETRGPAAVEVNARQAAAKALAGPPRLRLADCSRWPERADCDQDCVTQIEADPEGCRVYRIVESWYRNKECVYCHRPIRAADWLDYWLDHKPALLDPERRTHQWNEVPAEELPGRFARELPVCWDCHLAETFRREHPDLVTDRPWRRAS
jgi:hypothetical protein